jgi:hypothetical protein
MASWHRTLFLFTIIVLISLPAGEVSEPPCHPLPLHPREAPCYSLQGLRFLYLLMLGEQEQL